MPKRKMVRRSGRTRKRARVAPRPRVARNLRMATLYCTRKFYLENWQPSPVSTNGFWRYYQPSISQLPSLAEFQALFDAYRINAIKMEFHPRFNSFAGNDTTDTVLPGITNQAGTRWSVAIDPSSTLSPSGTYSAGTFNTFLESANRVKTHQGMRPFSIYFKPKVGYALGTVSTPAARRKAPYIQLSETGVSHFGVHVFATDNNFSGTFGNSCDVFLTFYMSFKYMK